MITYRRGDALAPVEGGNIVIAHICNDAGGFGKGFAAAVSKHHPEAERAYRTWHKVGRWDGTIFELGNVQFVRVSEDGTLFSSPRPDRFVANMVAQHGYRKRYDDPPVRYVDYEALAYCLASVCGFSIVHNARVVMPRIGTNLGGGSWDEIEPLIISRLCDYTVPVTVYDP